MSVPRDRRRCLRAGRDPRDPFDAARRLVILEGNDSHGDESSPVAPEDDDHASPAWWDRDLAPILFLRPGWGDRDDGLVKRTRVARGA